MADGIRIGQLEIDTASRRLSVGGRPASIGGRAFDLLQVLAERRDRVVGKRELLDLVWPGLAVEENNLQVQVCALRKLLGERSIVTVPRRGYRLVAEALDDPPGHITAEAAPPAQRQGGWAEAGLLAQLAHHRLVTLLADDSASARLLATRVANRAAAQRGGLVWHGDAGAAHPVPEALLGRRAAHVDVLVLDARHRAEHLKSLVDALLVRAPTWRLLVIADQPLAHAEEVCQRLHPAAQPAVAEPAQRTRMGRLRWHQRH